MQIQFLYSNLIIGLILVVYDLDRIRPVMALHFKKIFLFSPMKRTISLCIQEDCLLFAVDTRTNGKLP